MSIGGNDTTVTSNSSMSLLNVSAISNVAGFGEFAILPFPANCMGCCKLLSEFKLFSEDYVTRWGNLLDN
jgi:hypothetical protein